MAYSEKSKLEAEKASRLSIHNELEMIRNDISRMFFTNDMSELDQMYDSVKKHIDRIYEYHLARVKELQNLNVKAAE